MLGTKSSKMILHHIKCSLAKASIFTEAHHQYKPALPEVNSSPQSLYVIFLLVAREVLLATVHFASHASEQEKVGTGTLVTLSIISPFALDWSVSQSIVADACLLCTRRRLDGPHAWLALSSPPSKLLSPFLPSSLQSSPSTLAFVFVVVFTVLPMPMVVLFVVQG